MVALHEKARAYSMCFSHYYFLKKHYMCRGNGSAARESACV